MIIVGYQGIGKSTAAGRDGYIDLESSNFFVDGERIDNWHIPYCAIAEHLSNQGFVVMMSSHQVVRDQLKKDLAAQKFLGQVVCIVPSHSLRNSWIDKLKLRWYASNSDKDYKAYQNAADRFDENIEEITRSGLPYYEISNMDYDLRHIIDSLHANN